MDGPGDRVTETWLVNGWDSNYSNHDQWHRKDVLLQPPLQPAKKVNSINFLGTSKFNPMFLIFQVETFWSDYRKMPCDKLTSKDKKLV